MATAGRPRRWAWTAGSRGAGRGVRNRRLLPRGRSGRLLRAIGVDFSFGMLSAARGTRGVAGAGGRARAAASRTGPWTGSRAGSRCATSSISGALFAEMARVIRAGGRVAILEVAEPSNRSCGPGMRSYFNHVVPFVGSARLRRAAYRYLPRSVAYLPPPDGADGDAPRGRLRATRAAGRSRVASRSCSSGTRG